MCLAVFLALPLTALAGLLQHVAARALGVPGIGFLAVGAKGTPGKKRWWAQAIAVPVLYLVPALAFGLVAAGELPFGTRVEASAGFPAAAAGLQTGDRIVAINGTPVRRFAEIRPLIVPGKPNAIRLERGTIEVTPDEKGVLGLMPDRTDVVDPTAGEIVGAGLRGPFRVWEITVRTVGKIAMGPQTVEATVLAASGKGWGGWVSLVAIHLAYGLLLAYGAIAINAVLVELRLSGRRTAAT